MREVARLKFQEKLVALRNGNDGGIQRGQRPFLAHGLCLQSLVCYTLYLRVCEKSGTGILVAGFEADKKSFVSVPVSVTEVKLFDLQVEGI